MPASTLRLLVGFELEKPIILGVFFTYVFD